MNEVERAKAAKKLLIEIEAAVPYDESHDTAVKMRLALQVIRLKEEATDIKWGGRL